MYIKKNTANALLDFGTYLHLLDFIFDYAI